MKKLLQKIYEFKALSVFVVFALLFLGSAFGQTSVTIITSGPWVVPTGVTSIQVEAWGGGGGGGGTASSASKSGGGGSGGCYLKHTSISVTPGETLTITVGAGGPGGVGSAEAIANGGFSSVATNTTTLIKAGGGIKGLYVSGGGTGGLAVTTDNFGYEGNFSYKGGDGANGINGTGSAIGTPAYGGGAAGTNGNGSGITPGTDGGAGAAAKTASGSGNPGTAPGGGGGGGASAAASPKNGGAGGTGQVKITYMPLDPTINISLASLTGFTAMSNAVSASQTINISGLNLRSNITVSPATTNFEVSLSELTGYGTSVTISSGIGTVASTPIYVRVKSGATAGAISESIIFTSTDATSKTLIASGIVYTNYYYKGTGSLASVTNWGNATDGTGTNPPDFITLAGQLFNIRNTISVATDASWTVSGTGSKIIVGDPSVAAVTLTVSSGFGITTTSPAVLDIAAASSGANSVILQDSVTIPIPTFGTLNATSEVHFQATLSTGTTKTYGKIFVDGSGTTTTFTGTPIIQTSLTVASGSTMVTGATSTNFVTINSGASVTINGAFQTQKALGFVSSNVVTSSSTKNAIQFIGSENLTLGTSSTIGFTRSTSTSAQTIDARTDFVNLSISGADNNKNFATGTMGVSGAFTIGVSGTSVLSQPSVTTINYIGTSDQTLPSAITTYSNLGISGVGTKTTSANTTLTGVLTVGTGATLNTGGFLTLKSDANGTARVAPVLGIISGDVTVERHIPSRRAWRALTAPVITTNSIFTNWQEAGANGGLGNGANGFDIWMPNAATDSGLTSGGSGNSLLEYNSADDNNWTGISTTKGASSMMNGLKNKPFMAFVTGPYGTGNIGSNSAATTLRAKGALLIGQQTYTTIANKYTFIGNPYASPLSLSSMITSNNGSFEGNIWIWDANTTVANPVGIYNLYNATATAYSNTTSTTTVAPTTEIQSGQAFFVRSTAGHSFIIEESNKGTTNSAASTVFRDAAPAQLLRVGLYKQINTEWSGRDGAMTVILADANANQTPNKMANGTENVAFTKNGLLFASEHHLPLVASDVLNVKVWNTTAGANYKLKINTEQFATTSLNATLEDLFTNSRTPLTLDGTAVEYPFAVTTETASSGNRFRIVFENSALGINNPKTTGISILPNPITGDAFQVNFGTLGMGRYTYSICNALGQEVEKGSINNVAQNTNSFVKFKNNTAAGMYIMKVTGADNSVFTAKIIKQ
jgi:hypothetical protein